MGLSETIIAASIGAAATVSTALFQLFSALRANNNSRADSRPKKGNTLKSIMAVVALMIVSGVGGFLFSEFRSERTATDMHSMRDDINAKLQVLAETTSRLAERDAANGAMHLSSAPMQSAAVTATPVSVESIVFAPGCVSGAACTEASSQPMALCGAIPSSMQVRKFELYLKSTDALEGTKAEFEQDLGGAKFSGPPVEYPQGENRKAVCVSFLHWSNHPHIATLVLQYGASVDIGPTTVQPVPGTSVIAAQSAPPVAQAAMTSQLSAP